MIWRKAWIHPVFHIALVQFFLFFVLFWCNSSYSSYRPDAIHLILHIVLAQFILILKLSWCKIASTARNWINSAPQIAAIWPLPSLLSLSFVFGVSKPCCNCQSPGVRILTSAKIKKLDKKASSSLLYYIVTPKAHGTIIKILGDPGDPGDLRGPRGPEGTQGTWGDQGDPGDLRGPRGPRGPEGTQGTQGTWGDAWSLQVFQLRCHETQLQ